jgi:hypothetical protein
MATEKRYKVPDGMLEAAVEAWRMPGFDGFDDGLPHVAATNTTRKILEAAVYWLAEHPVVPTDEQMYKLLGSSMVATDRFAVEHALIRWQRQLFIAPPEPEPVPIPGDDPTFLDNLLDYDYTAAHAPKGVDRIDVYAGAGAGAGVLIASRSVHPEPPPPPPAPEAPPAPQVAKCALFTSIDFGPRPRVRVTCDCGEFSTSFATTGDVAYDAARQADATRLGWQHIEDRVASIPEPTPAPPASPKGL